MAFLPFSALISHRPWVAAPPSPSEVGSHPNHYPKGAHTDTQLQLSCVTGEHLPIHYQQLATRLPLAVTAQGAPGILGCPAQCEFLLTKNNFKVHPNYGMGHTFHLKKYSLIV